MQQTRGSADDSSLVGHDDADMNDTSMGSASGVPASQPPARGPKGLALRRTTIAAAAGAIALAATAGAGAAWPVAVVIGWDVGAIVEVVWVWSGIWRRDAADTERLAAAEDPAPSPAERLMLNAGVASLVAIAFVLNEAGHATGVERGVLTAFALASVLLSWALVQTILTLRYARLYYAQPVGGIGFSDDDPPGYADFAYVAFTIGMCFQVSDTDLAKRPIRRAALHHALLSYVFGSVILAVTVNSVAAILG
jgi:uncharacterized membrane protein